MPSATILVPGYGAQGGTATDAIAAARPDGSAFIVNASRSLMYAYRKKEGADPIRAAAEYAENMRLELNVAISARRSDTAASRAS